MRTARELPAEAIVVVLLPDHGRGYLGKVFDDDWMRAQGFETEDDARGILPPAAEMRRRR